HGASRYADGPGSVAARAQPGAARRLLPERSAAPLARARGGGTLGRVSAHAGPFVVFAEETHEDSADLLFMPDATAAEWATAFARLGGEAPGLAHAMLVDLGRIMALRLRMASEVIAQLRGS